MQLPILWKHALSMDFPEPQWQCWLICLFLMVWRRLSSVQLTATTLKPKNKNWCLIHILVALEFFLSSFSLLDLKLDKCSNVDLNPWNAMIWSSKIADVIVNNAFSCIGRKQRWEEVLKEKNVKVFSDFVVFKYIIYY